MASSFLRGSFDVNRLRDPHESEGNWKLRKEFILANFHAVPLNRLQGLSRCFTNVQTLGCVYPRHIMEQLRHLSPARDIHNMYVCAPAMGHARLPATQRMTSRSRSRNFYRSSDVSQSTGVAVTTGQFQAADKVQPVHQTQKQTGKSQKQYSESPQLEPLSPAEFMLKKLCCKMLGCKFEGSQQMHLGYQPKSAASLPQEKVIGPGRQERGLYSSFLTSETQDECGEGDSGIYRKLGKGIFLRKGRNFCCQKKGELDECKEEASGVCSEHASSHAEADGLLIPKTWVQQDSCDTQKQESVTHRKLSLKSFIKVLKRKRAAKDTVWQHALMQDSVWFQQQHYEAAEVLYHTHNAEHRATKSDQGEMLEIPPVPEGVLLAMEEQMKKYEMLCHTLLPYVLPSFLKISESLNVHLQDESRKRETRRHAVQSDSSGFGSETLPKEELPLMPESVLEVQKDQIQKCEALRHRAQSSSPCFAGLDFLHFFSQGLEGCVLTEEIRSDGRTDVNVLEECASQNSQPTTWPCDCVDFKPTTEPPDSVDSKPATEHADYMEPSAGVDSQPSTEPSDCIDSNLIADPDDCVDSQPTQEPSYCMDSQPTAKLSYCVDFRPVAKLSDNVDSIPTTHLNDCVDSQPSTDPSDCMDSLPVTKPFGGAHPQATTESCDCVDSQPAAEPSDCADSQPSTESSSDCVVSLPVPTTPDCLDFQPSADPHDGVGSYPPRDSSNSVDSPPNTESSDCVGYLCVTNTPDHMDLQPTADLSYGVGLDPTTNSSNSLDSQPTTELCCLQEHSACC